jgi:putative spermidine/putrescine transport system substrate-binding protein
MGEKGMRVLAVVSSGLLLSFGLLGTASSQETVTAVSWGGSYQDSLRKAFFEPAAKALGITINEDTLNGVADVRLQVQSGAPTWDIVEVGSSECIEADHEGLLAPIDYGVVSKDGLPASMTPANWVASSYQSTVIAWNKNKYGADGPQTWADFWDTKKFPGTRALYNRPIKTLETALLADGVAPADVNKTLQSPEGIERAFKKLEELKPNVAVWWTSGGQSMQLVNDGEVDMLAIWNGRIAAAIDDGAPYAFTFNQAILDWNCFAIPKGSAHVALANKVIGEMMTPEIQANLPNYVTYGPANALAFKTGKIADDVVPTINSAPVNTALQIPFDGEWWAVNEPKLQERYESLLQQ